ncbi:hypothetical protein KI387_037478, partial [Taxus chinensis]
RIPPVFARKLRNEIGIGGSGVLQGPSRHRWAVKICGTSTEMEFGQGWENFVQHHIIEFGDFLVFKYICRSYFKVRIFGKSGCEKNIPEMTSTDYYLQNRFSATPALRRFDSQIPTDMDSDNIQAETAVENEEVVRLNAPGNYMMGLGHCQPSLVKKKNETVRSAETKTEEKSYIGTYYVSRRRPVTQIEKSEALNAATSFRSSEPFCLVTMKPSFVYKGFRLSFTKACATILQLPRERTEVVLVGQNNKEWHAHYIGERYCLSGGWGYFSRDNFLEEGDVCIFERVDNGSNKIKLRVHIFRVVKECTPCKRMKSKIVPPANHSNEKTEVLREDLSSEAFGSKQGKNAKQGRKHIRWKLEKDNSGNNCLKLARYTPDISDRKAGCWDSLTFAQTSNFVVSPKKELLCSPSSADEQEYNGRDIVIPSQKAISLADVNVNVNDGEDGVFFNWETSDAGHEMPPTSRDLIPSEQSLGEGTLMANSIVPLLNLKPVATVALFPKEAISLANKMSPSSRDLIPSEQSLSEGTLMTNSIVPVLNPKPVAVVALFPKESISLADTNGEANLKSGSGIKNENMTSYYPFTEPIDEETFVNGRILDYGFNC